jgi:VIT1/CCC1 family predicted Fe2+/Mn2+ transporter
VITTLGLIVGLNSGTHSRPVVIGGILTIALADAFSDALGIHVSEEADHRHSAHQVWVATIATFFTKLFFSLTFLLPIIFFQLSHAIMISLVWGLVILVALSYFIAKVQKSSPVKVIFEHVLIAMVVIIATHFLAFWISSIFK